ncbi:MAG: amidohydrolase [Chloroflexi bacterium]|nr:amidohydrolase [Chloroflexota bacterium]
MIVDIHAHMLNRKDLDRLLAIGGPAFRQGYEKLTGMISGNTGAFDVPKRVASLDRYGIDYQLVAPMPPVDPNNLSLDPDTELKLVAAFNDGMARITGESKGRILCAGTVSMAALETGGLQEVERAIRQLGLKGFGLTTHIKGKPLSAPEFRPFWAKTAELGAIVFLHPASTANSTDRSYEARYNLMQVFGWPFETTLALSHLVFSGIMDEFPGLKIVAHHLGGMIPFFWGRMAESYHPRLAGKRGIETRMPLKKSFGKFYYDTAVGDNPGAIRCAYEIFGAGRLALATDAPFGANAGDHRMKTYPEVIRRLGLPERDTARILGENARKLLEIGKFQ